MATPQTVSAKSSAKPVAAKAAATTNTRKKPELKFVTDRGEQIVLVVDVGGSMVTLKAYCAQHKINFFGVKRRLYEAGRVDGKQSCIKLATNDAVLVQGAMKSSSLKLLVVSESGLVHNIYANDLEKVVENIHCIFDLRNRRVSSDGGVTWVPFSPLAGAEEIKKLVTPARKPKPVAAKTKERVAV